MAAVGSTAAGTHEAGPHCSGLTVYKNKLDSSGAILSMTQGRQAPSEVSAGSHTYNKNPCDGLCVLVHAGPHG